MWTEWKNLVDSKTNIKLLRERKRRIRKILEKVAVNESRTGNSLVLVRIQRRRLSGPHTGMRVVYVFAWNAKWKVLYNDKITIAVDSKLSNNRVNGTVGNAQLAWYQCQILLLQLHTEIIENWKRFLINWSLTNYIDNKKRSSALYCTRALERATREIKSC